MRAFDDYIEPKVSELSTLQLITVVIAYAKVFYQSRHIQQFTRRITMGFVNQRHYHEEYRVILISRVLWALAVLGELPYEVKLYEL